jgi:hypothetical protein
MMPASCSTASSTVVVVSKDSSSNVCKKVHHVQIQWFKMLHCWRGAQSVMLTFHSCLRQRGPMLSAGHAALLVAPEHFKVCPPRPGRTQWCSGGGQQTGPQSPRWREAAGSSIHCKHTVGHQHVSNRCPQNTCAC